MRDPARIEEILLTLREVWKQYPDVRFCQLVVNIARLNDPFYLEDEDFLAYLKYAKHFLDKGEKNA